MSYLGNVGEFNKDKEWQLYVDRLEQFFAANGIANEKKVPLMLSVIGAETYRLLNDLFFPAKPKTKTFKELVECLEKHFSPPTIKIAERFKLLKRVQREDETISEYAAILRKLAVTCQYGTFLDDALTQCFVCGLANPGIQRRLLLETELSFEKAIQTAKAIHQADQEIEKFHSVPEAHVKKLRSFPAKFNEGKSILCFRCSGRGHLASTCRFSSAKCYRCGRVGHVARACLSKQHKESNVNKMNEGDEDVNEDIVNKVTISETGVIWVKPCINDKNINMQY